MNTGEILKACREKRDLSLSDLAYKCDSTWSRINYLEKRPDCKVSTLDMLLHELGYEIDIMPVERLEDGLVKCRDCIYWKRYGSGYSWCTSFEKQFGGSGFCPEGIRRPEVEAEK